MYVVSRKGQEIYLSQSEEKFDVEGFNRLKKQFEEYEAKMRERLGKFNINEILRQAKDLRSVFVEGLGEVRYVLLTEKDISEIAKQYPEDKREQNLQGLFRSMAAADSEVTLDKLRVLPFDVSQVLQETVLNSSFLPIKKISNSGSASPVSSKA